MKCLPRASPILVASKYHCSGLRKLLITCIDPMVFLSHSSFPPSSPCTDYMYIYSEAYIYLCMYKHMHPHISYPENVQNVQSLTLILPAYLSKNTILHISLCCILLPFLRQKKKATESHHLQHEPSLTISEKGNNENPLVA